MTPLGNNVLVEVLAEDLRRASGLYIPDAVKHPSCQGTIVAAGPSVRDLLPGDRVLFHPYQEEDVSITFWPDPADPSREFILMPEDLVLAVLEESPP
ncbi:MAG: co-chaperone GroES [Armatimonadota bacterium]|nr:co-chaperone GroES [Armatimonadota bacterium]MDR7534564.1 co-chaperone GroES [Armatimonadota bacterium]